jgi:hypothetical protein
MSHSTLRLLSVAVLALSAPLGAQSARSRPVHLIVLESFSSPGLAIAIRRDTGTMGQELVAIKSSSLSPEVLITALDRVRKAQELSPVPSGSAMIVVSENTRRRPINTAERAIANALIRRLQRAPKVAIPRIGTVPRLTLTEADLRGQ